MKLEELTEAIMLKSFLHHHRAAEREWKQMETKTMNAMEDIKGYWLEWPMASNNKIYTQKELEKQVKQGYRPDSEDMINPVLAQYNEKGKN